MLALNLFILGRGVDLGDTQKFEVGPMHSSPQYFEK